MGTFVSVSRLKARELLLTRLSESIASPLAVSINSGAGHGHWMTFFFGEGAGEGCAAAGAEGIA